MLAPSEHHNLQAATIEYIKKIAQQLENEPNESSSDFDSLIISESEASQSTVKLPIPQPTQKKKEKYAVKYVSPYKQTRLFIRNIEASGRQPVSPQVSFSNTLLQITTSREKTASRLNISPSRYMTNHSMIERLEVAALDQLRKQARKMHQIQEKQRIEMSPRKKNERWADFLLRERKWEEQKHMREMEKKQKAIVQQRKLSNRVTERPKQTPGLTRQNVIRMVKRQKSKLEERLRGISLKSYKWKDVNIRADNHPSPQKPRAASNKLIIFDPKQALFLVEHS